MTASATRIPDAAGYEVWLLGVGALHFEKGMVLPHRATDVVVNALLLQGHGEVVLVDTGSGVVDDWWPGAAQLDEALALAGVAAADVTCALLTHLDFDHAGGALAGSWPDRLAARFARTVIAEEAVEWWLARTDDNVGGPLIRAIDPERVPDGGEVCPRIRISLAPGHRPGHSVVLVGDELVHGADLIHHAEHVEHPDWDHAFDYDVRAALDTREAWLHRLEAAGTPVVFSHLHGRGRIVAGRRWEVDR